MVAGRDKKLLVSRENSIGNRQFGNEVVAQDCGRAHISDKQQFCQFNRIPLDNYAHGRCSDMVSTGADRNSSLTASARSQQFSLS